MKPNMRPDAGDPGLGGAEPVVPGEGLLEEIVRGVELPTAGPGCNGILSCRQIWDYGKACIEAVLARPALPAPPENIREVLEAAREVVLEFADAFHFGQAESDEALHARGITDDLAYRRLKQALGGALPAPEPPPRLPTDREIGLRSALNAALVDLRVFRGADDHFVQALEQLVAQTGGAALPAEHDLPRVDENGCYTLPDGSCAGCSHCPHAIARECHCGADSDMHSATCPAGRMLPAALPPQTGNLEGPWRISLTRKAVPDGQWSVWRHPVTDDSGIIHPQLTVANARAAAIVRDALNRSEST